MDEGQERVPEKRWERLAPLTLYEIGPGSVLVGFWPSIATMPTSHRWGVGATAVVS